MGFNHPRWINWWQLVSLHSTLHACSLRFALNRQTYQLVLLFQWSSMEWYRRHIKGSWKWLKKLKRSNFLDAFTPIPVKVKQQDGTNLASIGLPMMAKGTHKTSTQYRLMDESSCVPKKPSLPIKSRCASATSGSLAMVQPITGPDHGDQTIDQSFKVQI